MEIVKIINESEVRYYSGTGMLKNDKTDGYDGYGNV
jgi:hypothetical protein